MKTVSGYIYHIFDDFAKIFIVKFDNARIRIDDKNKKWVDANDGKIIQLIGKASLVWDTEVNSLIPTLKQCEHNLITNIFTINW